MNICNLSSNFRVQRVNPFMLNSCDSVHRPNTEETFLQGGNYEVNASEILEIIKRNVSVVLHA